MANEVANPFGAGTGMVDRAAMARKAQESSQSTPRAGAPDGSDYMNFSGKKGVYTIGKDQRKVQADELWLLNVASFEDGYICWKGGKPASTRLSNIYTGVPVQQPADDELGPFNTGKGDGWYMAKGWVAKSIDYDQQGYFKNNSVSGVSEMSSMLEEVSGRMAVGKACWPVFSYDIEEFEAQGFKNYKPIFKVSGWLDDAALAKTLEEDFDIDKLMAQSAKRDEANAQHGAAKVTKEAPDLGGVNANGVAPDGEEAEDVSEEDAEEATAPSRRRRRTAS